MTTPRFFGHDYDISNNALPKINIFQNYIPLLISKYYELTRLWSGHSQKLAIQRSHQAIPVIRVTRFFFSKFVTTFFLPTTNSLKFMRSECKHLYSSLIYCSVQTINHPDWDAVENVSVFPYPSMQLPPSYFTVIAFPPSPKFPRRLITCKLSHIKYLRNPTLHIRPSKTQNGIQVCGRSRTARSPSPTKSIRAATLLTVPRLACRI